MEPLSEVDLQLAVHAEGRLINVNGPDGGPALRGASANLAFRLPVTVTRAGSHWVIVR